MADQLPSRRKFLKKSTLGAGALFFHAALPLRASPFGRQDGKLGIALVGLGSYSRGKLAPALLETNLCYLAGIVTGTPAKAEEWSAKYDIPKANIYNYETFDRIADNADIDVIYVVLPNGMHAEYTIRAAQAGKHVICEKPMANTPEECKAMIQACRDAGVKLQIGYRCQYDPQHIDIMRMGQQEEYGPVKVIQTGNGFHLGGKSDNWRYTDPALAGGGALMDMGVYCTQGARYSMGREPVAVQAQSYNFRPELIHPDLDDTMTFQLEFEGGAIANCMCSYNARSDYLLVSAAEGNFGLEPCYQYNKPEGMAGGEPFSYPATNQQAVQMDAFARNIMEDTAVKADGEEGLRDMLVVDALYRSVAAGGTRVRVAES